MHPLFHADVRIDKVFSKTSAVGKITRFAASALSRHFLHKCQITQTRTSALSSQNAPISVFRPIHRSQA